MKKFISITLLLLISLNISFSQEIKNKGHYNNSKFKQLDEELKTNTYIDVGKKYNVSDNTIRNWIKQYN